jgi:hypothetical protein
MSPPTGSTWWCELCRVEEVLAHHQKRRRYRLCRKWMTRTR